jgi:hypothetical protein
MCLDLPFFSPSIPSPSIPQEWFRDPGYIHSVLLSGLALDTTYYYQFGNDVDGWSQVYQFNSA